MKQVIINDKLIYYEINYKKIKNLYFRLQTENKVSINAPHHLSDKKIQRFLVSAYPSLLKKYQKRTKDKQLPFNEKFVKILGKEVKLSDNLDKQLSDNLNEYLNNNYLRLVDLLSIPVAPKLKLKRVKSYLGQYNKKQHQINLNILIAHLNEEEVEYILIHELAHVFYLHHQKSFWNFVGKYCPNYLAIRRKVKKEFVYYENN